MTTASSPCREFCNSLGLLILRLGVGGYMLTHGWGKLQTLLDGNFKFAGDPIGIGETLSAIGIVASEFGCAILIMAGLLTRLGAFGIVFAMSVAAFVVHADHSWTMGEGPSKEPALLYLIPALALIFTGAGKISLDHLIWSRCCARRANTRAAS